jgi:hypothetical protein
MLSRGDGIVLAPRRLRRNRIDCYFGKASVKSTRQLSSIVYVLKKRIHKRGVLAEHNAKAECLDFVVQSWIVCTATPEQVSL